MECSRDERTAQVASLLRGIRPYFSPMVAKRVLVVVALSILPAAAYALVAPSTAETASCPIVGTVADYVALGSVGCTIDDKIFSNFNYRTSTAGTGIAISAGGVSVTPLNDSGNPGLTFTAPWSAAATSVTDAATLSFIFFDVRTTSGAALIENASVKADFTADFTGTGSFSDNAEAAGCFNASSTTNCSGKSGTFFIRTTNNSGVLTNPSGDTAIFTPVALVGVNSVSIDAIALLGAGNSATVTSATYRFSEVSTPVPEPATAVLLGTGLLGLVSPRLLRHRRKSHRLRGHRFQDASGGE